MEAPIIVDNVTTTCHQGLCHLSDSVSCRSFSFWKIVRFGKTLDNCLCGIHQTRLRMDKSTAKGASISIPPTLLCLSGVTLLYLSTAVGVSVRDANNVECNNIESPAVLSMMGFVISPPTTPKAILTSITPSYNHPLPFPSFADPLPRQCPSQASTGMLS